MKKAPAVKQGAAVEGKPDFTDRAGMLPKRLATVTSEVLARLLSGEYLTSLDSVVDSSTTRLGAFIHRLVGDYGWQIESEPFAAGCVDGRVSWPHRYYLRPEIIAAARASGAVAWCKDVRSARAALRKKAAEARREAERRNEAMAAARRRADPGQFALDLGGAL